MKSQQECEVADRVEGGRNWTLDLLQTMSPSVHHQEREPEKGTRRGNCLHVGLSQDAKEEAWGGGGADDTFLSASRQDDRIRRCSDSDSALKTLDPKTTSARLPRYATPLVPHRQQNWSNLWLVDGSMSPSGEEAWGTWNAAAVHERQKNAAFGADFSFCSFLSLCSFSRLSSFFSLF